LRLRVTLIFALVAGAVVSSAPAEAQASCAGARSTPGSAGLARARHATLCLLNRQRRRHGLAPLRIDHRLGRAAHAYSRSMVRRDFFDHVSPVNGSTLSDRIHAVGYRAALVGENLAWGTGRLATPARIVSGWMHSPGHRANILTPGYRSIGIGIVNGAPGRSGRGATYTTDFGTRR
jgi:uncharacterized protein YkwD